MSGIVGIVNVNGAPIERGLLGGLTDSMAYRGPDACGTWLDGPVGFGHRLLRSSRVSQDGPQPGTLDSRVWITADARLDARADLVRMLESHGRSDAAQADDAQLIVHAYAVWGEDCVDHLLGDFAFAIWDMDRRALFCARDHLGVKPFYYAHVSDHLVFSNTLNCVRLHPAISAELNDRAIGDFLLFGCNHDPTTTVFADIRRLQPAHVLTWSRGASLRVRRYWTLPVDGAAAARRDGEWLDEFRGLWRTAVDDRLRTDRVGVLMSGGLDSTSVAVTAHACLSSRSQLFDLRAYTVVYDRLIPDRERHYAGLVADSLGIPIHFLAADTYGVLDRLDEAGCQTPEPSDHPLPAVTADLFRDVASQCRIALSGEGGDPVLSGPTASDFANLLRRGRVGAWTTGVFRCVLHGERPPLGIRSALKRWTGNGARQPQYPPWISDDFAARVDLPGRWRQVHEGTASSHSLRPATYRELCSPFWPFLFETYDPGFTSLPLQFRHPFFDVRLLTYLLAVPAVPWFLNKRILREAMRGGTPEAVRRRPKTPMLADPVCALLQRPAARRLNGLRVTPELLQYVDLSKVPKVAGLPALVSQYGSAWHVLTRPLCLNYWLAHAASARATEKEWRHGETGRSEGV
jgi:asparagine synthase (glutamine-hydrolysing)